MVGMYSESKFFNPNLMGKQPSMRSYYAWKLQSRLK